MGHIHDISFSCLVSAHKIKSVEGNITFGLDWHGPSAPIFRTGADVLRSLPQVFEAGNGQAKVVEHVDLVFSYVLAFRGLLLGPAGQNYKLIEEAQVTYRSKGFEWVIVGFKKPERAVSSRRAGAVGYLQNNIRLCPGVKDGHNR